MKPDTVGPSAGPANGARVKRANALPLVSASQISAIKAPEFVRGAAAKVPPRNRNTRTAAVFGARALPTWKPWVSSCEKTAA